MKTHKKGEVHFVKSFKNWSLEIQIKWNKRMTYTTIKSRKTDLKVDFPTCKLYHFRLFTLLSYMSFMRSDSFSFSGTKSEYSELILGSSASYSLMESKNAAISLKNKFLIFSGGTRKKDIKSLSNIFILNEMLMTEIDELHNRITKNNVC
ncbi:hypothetical protein [Psychroserpens sp. SPM9]|uniref:hypothetical protein n=1 Tax=Psychroserpens sp. SPM9 TaxID=2975598 RepID=UPI0021A8C3A1|nr:hypothetical protein [Psychroserpens sp. SPM9]MDG5493200.1 hypothetical protein [Psychroserpens sp. SPM9]